MSRSARCAFAFGLLFAVQASLFVAAHLGWIDLELFRLDQVRAAGSALLLLGTVSGLSARKRWGWKLGLVAVSLILLDAMLGTVVDPEFEPASISALGAVFLICAGLLVMMDSDQVRAELSPAAPRSGHLYRLPAGPLARTGLVLLTLPMVFYVWGWLVLVLWLALLWVVRIRSSRAGGSRRRTAAS